MNTKITTIASIVIAFAAAIIAAWGTFKTQITAVVGTSDTAQVIAVDSEVRQ